MLFPQGDKLFVKAVQALPEPRRVAMCNSELDSAGLLRAYPRISSELLERGLVWRDSW